MNSGCWGASFARRSAACALLVVAASHPSTGRAQSVEDGEAAYFAAEFEGASRIFEDILQSEAASPGDLAEAHRYLGALRAMLGEPDAASRHVTMAVALNPEAIPPEGVPPEVEAAFAEARANTPQRAEVQLGTGDVLRQGESAIVTARLAPTLPLVSRIALECESGDERASEEAPSPSVVAEIVLGGDTVRCRAAAQNASGVSLLSANWEEPVAAAEQSDDGPLLAGVVGGVAGALVLAGAIVLAVVLTSDGGDQASVGAPTVVGW